MNIHKYKDYNTQTSKHKMNKIIKKYLHKNVNNCNFFLPCLPFIDCDVIKFKNTITYAPRTVRT